MNLTDIGSILYREIPEEYADTTHVLNIETQALKLFLEEKSLVEVAILLNLLNAKSEDQIEYYKKYLRLNRMHSIVKLLDLDKDKLRLLFGFG